MINAEDWWKVLENYNASIFPLQIALYILAVAVTVLIFVKPNEKTDIIVKGYFAFSFAWIGIVFFLLLGSELPTNYLQAFLFLALSGLFVLDIFTKTTEFRPPEETKWKILNITFVVLAFLYPVVGLLFGHFYPRMIIPGTFPCPTVALALALMAPVMLQKVNKITYGLLLLWAIPFPIFIQIPQFGAYEDMIMLLIGFYSLVYLLWKWRLPKLEVDVSLSTT